MAYVRAHTLGDALEAMQRGDATPVAGATDVYPANGEGRLRGSMVDISAVPELNMIEADAHTIRIGASVTWSEIVRAALPPAFDGLKAAAREVGAVQIQNRATVCGNLCTASPAGDGIPCLLALDAQVELASANGTRRLSLGDFVTGVRTTALSPGELLTAIIVPRPTEGARGAFAKLGARHYLVISIAMASAVLTPDAEGRIAQAAVAIGACSPVATRLSSLETALLGVPLSAAADIVVPAHMAPLSPISDVRGTAAYRLEAAEELTRRVLGLCHAPQALAA